MTRERAPRFTAVGPGEHHLAIARALPCIDASSVDLAVDAFGVELERTQAATARRGSTPATLARAIADLVRACDVSYLCVEASSDGWGGALAGATLRARRALGD